MKPITFECNQSLPLAPEAIAEQILDLKRWPDFRGYGPLPGIKTAEFELRTPNVVGSRIRVINTDGSRHMEQIVEWQPTSRLRLHMHEFAAPLSHLAVEFFETWSFQGGRDETQVCRTFELWPRSNFTRPALWMISLLLRRAIDRHLEEMRH